VIIYIFLGPESHRKWAERYHNYANKQEKIAIYTIDQTSAHQLVRTELIFSKIAIYTIGGCRLQPMFR
jgi:DICT domain-containing protein